ncbi:MAG: prepilin-type N-terminal cleavage/methylation domain-containing protein, partial [Pseudomonadota bacterium]
MKRTLINGRRQHGFTLIEIMIAIVIGLILTGGIIQVFTATRQSNRVHEELSRMQENGRMALEVIARDARMADFWGCSGDISNVMNHLDTGGSGFIDFMVGGVDGTDGGGGSDILVLRGGSGNGLGVQSPFGPATSTALTVSTGNGIAEGDIVMVSDCETA